MLQVVKRLVRREGHDSVDPEVSLRKGERTQTSRYC